MAASPPPDFKHSTLFDDLQQVLQAAGGGAHPPAQTRQALAWCGTGAWLRGLLLTLAAVDVALAFRAEDFSGWLQTLPAAALQAIPAVLLWMLAACAFRLRLAVWPPLWAQTALVLGGSVSALLVALGLQALGWQSLRLTGVWGLALAGGGLAALMVHLEQLREKARLPAVATARLADLQTRIRPHFLFNTLNTAIALVRLDPQRAEEVLEDLAELFRAALGSLDQATTLGAEVSLTQRYLSIEQLRFGSRLEVDWHLDPQANGARLPPLTLQPLIENAVRHGVEPSDKGGVIEVRTLRRRDRVLISITNTRPSNPSRPGHGIGLASVKERLRLMHDLDADMRSGQIEDGRWRVSLAIPA